MRTLVYAILIALALLVFKAFYLDSYLENYGRDENVTEENVSEAPAAEPIVQPVYHKPEPIRVPEKKEPEKPKSVPSSTAKEGEKMPLDRLGDNIADKLEGKI